jgi:hypothetical protein
MHESDAALFHHQGNARKLVPKRSGKPLSRKRPSEQLHILIPFQDTLRPTTVIRIESTVRQVRHYLQNIP